MAVADTGTRPPHRSTAMPRSIIRTVTTAIAIAALAAPTALARPADMPPAVAKAAAAAQHKQDPRSPDAIDAATRDEQDARSPDAIDAGDATGTRLAGQPAAGCHAAGDRRPRHRLDDDRHRGRRQPAGDRRHRRHRQPHPRAHASPRSNPALGCRPPHRHPRAAAWQSHPRAATRGRDSNPRGTSPAPAGFQDGKRGGWILALWKGYGYWRLLWAISWASLAEPTAPFVGSPV